MNTLRGFLLDHMAQRGWDAAELAASSGLAAEEIAPLLGDETLSGWPSPAVVKGLAKALQVPCREVVLQAAEACGVPVDAPGAAPVAAPAEALVEEAGILQATNEVLLREVRRRLALGAASGSYLASERDRGVVIPIRSAQIG